MVLEFLFHNIWLLVEVLSTHLGFCAPVKLSEFEKEKKNPNLWCLVSYFHSGVNRERI